MFTGLIQRLGRVSHREETDRGARFVIRPVPGTPAWPGSPPVRGDSIAVNGCCLTLTNDFGGDFADGSGDDSGKEALHFDVIRQTLRLTTLNELRDGQTVHLETAATPSTALGGHIVQGHIDGVGRVVGVDQSGGEWRVKIEPPENLLDGIIDRGSIAVNGVSLTVAERRERSFVVALIPTTLELTNLDELKRGDRVNLETDYVARIVVNWLQRYGQAGRFPGRADSTVMTPPAGARPDSE